MRVCLTLSILFPAFGDKTTTTEGNLPTKQTGLYAVYLLFRNSDLVWDCARGMGKTSTKVEEFLCHLYLALFADPKPV